MKTLKIALMSAVAALSLSACKSEPKILVLYYSQTGTTKAVAEEFASRLGADIAAFDVTIPYDGDFNATVARAGKERAEGFIPALKEPDCDLTKYETIFLGYPIWYGTYAPPVASLLEAYDFSGKTIVPFCSFGSGGLEDSMKDLKAKLPKAYIRDGYGVRTARVASVPKEVERFLIENGYLKGEIAPLPEYSEQQPVTEVEAGIFDAACSSYMFPFGTPTAFSKRSIPDGTDYKFIVNSVSPDGEASTSVSYVIAPESGNPEFTRVVR